MSKIVTSLQNPAIKQAVSLHLKKYRDETGLFLVEGEEFCVAALENGWICNTLFIEGTDESGLGQGIEDKLVYVTSEVQSRIAKKDNPQKVIGVFHKRDNAILAPEGQKITPVLEEIRDPGNLGTIMRTCHALGLRQIILIGSCCDPYAPEAIRASMGGFAVVEIMAVTRDELVAWGTRNPDTRWIGTDVAWADDYRAAHYAHALLLMGNEQKGLSAALKTHCTTHVKIPMPGGAESLNVAMATTLLLYEAMRPHL